MKTDIYFTDEKFEKKELDKRFFYLILISPSMIFFLWWMSATSYSNNEIKPIYLFIYNSLKYSPLLILLALIRHKIKHSSFEKLNPYIGILIVFLFVSSFILVFFSTLFDLKGENREFFIDSVFFVSILLFLIYFIIYYFRYMKRAKKGRSKYLNQLKEYHYIIDTQSQDIEHNYFRIKNKKLEEKLDILAIFIKILTPTIATITIFIGYKYIQNGENDPSIFILAFIGILGSAYHGSLIAFLLSASINLNQIEKQIGRKIYLGLYPKTIARKKAEAKENEEYWEKRLEEEENKKSKKENS